MMENEMNKIDSGQPANRPGPAKRAGGRVAPRRPARYTDERETATSGRLRRRPERWDGLAAASRLALITMLEHGGHERPIIHRGGKHLRSKMGSRKTGRQQVVEGRGHRDLTKINECDPDVLDYQAHPFEIRFQVGGVPMVYYPDHIRLLRDGTVELIEVKRDPADLTDPDYRNKLAAVAEIARRVGWRFRILYHDAIAGPPDRMRNVEAIYMQRFTALTASEKRGVAAFAAARDPGTWAALRERICPGDARRGESVLRCAIARAQMRVDLDAPIIDTTRVEPRGPVSGRGTIRI